VLLLVALHDLWRPRMSCGVVLVKFAPSTPLAKKVPSLVQGDLDLPQAVLLIASGTRADMALLELTFFSNECRDTVEQLFVVHLAPPLADLGTV
jgi:hypothetical protein